MPSELVVPIAEIKNLRPHPDAERLEVCEVLGWQLVVGKDLYKEGERIIYVPPDSVVPQELSDALDITKFLSNGRVRQVKLRGEPSFGATVPLELAKSYEVDPNLPLGTDVAEKLGITKYEPPVRAVAGDAVQEDPLFQKYTSIVNIRNFPNILLPDEEVMMFEKIHGTNCRVGLINGNFVAGSHGLQRAEPEDYSKNTYWYPLSLEPVMNVLQILGKLHKQVIVYGEVYGNIQKKYHYGIPNGVGFRAFDLLVDGKYAHAKDFVEICDHYGIEYAPLLATGVLDYDEISKLAESYPHSTMNDSHPMEGVVIKPSVERHDAKIGRVVLKYLTDTYLFDKNKSDFTDQ